MPDDIEDSLPIRALKPPRWVLIFSALVVLSTCIPYVYYLVATPADRVFHGHIENTYDQNTYYMWARQVQQGRLFVYDLCTTENHRPVLPSLPWLIVGLAARIIPVPLFYIYNLLRVASGFFYLILVYLIAAEFFEGERGRFYTLLIVGLGSGLGFFAHGVNVVVGREVLESADWIAELWAYHSILLYPHYTLSLLLLAALTWLLLRAYRQRRWSLYVGAIFFMVLLTLVHPFTAAVIVSTLLVHSAVCWYDKSQARRVLRVNLLAILGLLPPAAFFALQLRASSVMRAWQTQNVLESPSSLAYVMGLGVVFPLTLIGARLLLRQDRCQPSEWLLILWPLVAAIMTYSGPVVSFERRSVEGVHLPLAILSAIAVSRWGVPFVARQWLKGNHRLASLGWAALLVVLLVPTNFGLALRAMHNPGRTIPCDWVEGFRWLESSTDERVRIMAPRYLGSFISRYALRRVYVAHRQHTIDFDQKLETVATFFSPKTSASERVAILAETGCGIVAVDGENRGVLRGWAALEEVFCSPEMSVYIYHPNKGWSRGSTLP